MARTKLPTAKTRTHEVTCRGGPWHDQKMWVPALDMHDPLSLPIRVGDHVGRYNLFDGRWLPLTGE